MPIRPEHRWLYPIDWPQISWFIRFKRAEGHCERCRRPHGERVRCIDDGRWLDEEAGYWRDERGRRARPPKNVAAAAQGLLIEPLSPPVEEMRTTLVILAAAHLDHDPTNSAARNLAAFCQRCHLAHDRPEHRRQRWTTLFRRRALGDLFLGLYR